MADPDVCPYKAGDIVRVTRVTQNWTKMRVGLVVEVTSADVERYPLGWVAEVEPATEAEEAAYRLVGARR